MNDTEVQTYIKSVLDLTRLLVESTAGYRAQLEAQGFSPTAAEAMSQQFHGALIRQVFAGVQK